MAESAARAGSVPLHLPTPTFQPPYATLQPTSWHSHYPVTNLETECATEAAFSGTKGQRCSWNTGGAITTKWNLKKIGQHQPAPTSAPVGSSVHWMGWDFSSSDWMCIDPCWPLWCWPFPRVFFGWLFFFSTLTSPAQLHTTQPSWSYLLLRTRLPPPTLFLTYLPTRPLPPFPTN